MTFKWTFLKFSSIWNLLEFLRFRKHKQRILLGRGGEKKKFSLHESSFLPEICFSELSTEFSFPSIFAQEIIIEARCQLWQLILHLGSDPALWSHLARSGLEQSHVQWCQAWPLGKKMFFGLCINTWKWPSSVYTSGCSVGRRARRPG